MIEIDTIYTLEELKNESIHELRVILRNLGGVPGSKGSAKIIQDILDIQSGKEVEKPSGRGRKPKKGVTAVTALEKEKSADEEIQSTQDIKTADDAGKNDNFIDVYSEDDVYVPVTVQVRDSNAEEAQKIVIASGILEILDGYGFIKTYALNNKRRDFYVDKQIIKAYSLKTGDYLIGYATNKYEKESFYVTEIVKINGKLRGQFMRGKSFEEYSAIYPSINLISETESDVTLRALELLSPIGRGQRGLIVAPPKTGKTTLLKKLALSIEKQEDLHLIVLLIDERPEEVTDFATEITKGEIFASTFDQTAERHVKYAEIAIERAKRLVECGKHVVLLLDSLTKLTRAYNSACSSSGKTLSGGLEANALVMAKKIFGSARALKSGGSLTVIATTLIETGSRMDEIIFEEFKGTGNAEIVLSKELAEKRVFPAIDFRKSGTRKEELILSERKLDCAYKVRKLMAENKLSLERFLQIIKLTKNNSELVRNIDKWLE